MGTMRTMNVKPIYGGVVVSVEGDGDLILKVEGKVCDTQTIVKEGFLKATGLALMEMTMQVMMGGIPIHDQKFTPLDPLFEYIGERGVEWFKSKGVNLNDYRLLAESQLVSEVDEKKAEIMAMRAKEIEAIDLHAPVFAQEVASK